MAKVWIKYFILPSLNVLDFFFSFSDSLIIIIILEQDRFFMCVSFHGFSTHIT